MKETVNVNIASQAFTLDDDAYAVLRRYLDDIRRRLPQEDNNTMEDVEARIADIFRERLSSPMMVVSLALGTVRHGTTRAARRLRRMPLRPHGRLHGGAGSESRSPLRANSTVRAATAPLPASAADWPTTSASIRW